MTTWDPGTYLQFADQRGRPFADLLARVGAESPRTAVDLGCGPGQLTAALATRWPEASVTGIDSSAAMVERAQQHSGPRLSFAVGDLRDWQPEEPVDVLVSNATLHWVPGHRALLPRLLAAVAPSGWFAFQVPGNFDEPSHRLLHELAADPRFADATADVEWPSAAEPGDYLADLTSLGCEADVWETTYLHLLSGPDAVFRWISGTGARPALQSLDDTRRAEFEAEYKSLLTEAYPPGPAGTVLPFRRIFAVAQRSAAQDPGQQESR